MTDVYIHINHLRTRFEKTYYPKMIEVQDSQTIQPIVQLKMWQGNKGVIRYEPLVRIMSCILEVTVVRNSFNIEEGITIVGRAALVSLFIQLLESIKHKIDKTASTTPEKPQNDIHRSEHIANIKAKAIMAYVKGFEVIRRSKWQHLSMAYWIVDQDLRHAYISTSPLKTLKKYKPI